MPDAILRIRDLPHFRLRASDLAAWLEAQGEESWWSVDGDPVLTQRLDFPCPSDELAEELRRFDRQLLLLDSRAQPCARGEVLASSGLDEVAYSDDGNRAFQFCWADGPDVDWILFEDTETGRSSLGLDDSDE